MRAVGSIQDFWRETLVILGRSVSLFACFSFARCEEIQNSESSRCEALESGMQSVESPEFTTRDPKLMGWESPGFLYIGRFLFRSVSFF